MNNRYNIIVTNTAPVKHYRGDNCELPNPIERDKQIRELLGIIKGIPTTSKEVRIRDICFFFFVDVVF